jgi:hypothetical protein
MGLHTRYLCPRYGNFVPGNIVPGVIVVVGARLVEKDSPLGLFGRHPGETAGRLVSRGTDALLQNGYDFLYS